MQLSKSIESFVFIGNIYTQYANVFNNILALKKCNESFLDINLFMVKDITFEKIKELNIFFKIGIKRNNYTVRSIIENNDIFYTLFIEKKYDDYSLYSHIQKHYLILSDLLIEKENPLNIFFLGLNKKGGIDFFNEKYPNGCFLQNKITSHDGYKMIGNTDKYNFISLFNLKDNEEHESKHKEILLKYISSAL